MNTKTRKYRIKSTFRFTLFIILFVLMIITAAGTILGFNTADGLSEANYTEINVEAGDTLWAIASEYMPEDTDMRKNVHVLCEKNNITADTLQPGQTLVIPQD